MDFLAVVLLTLVAVVIFTMYFVPFQQKKQSIKMEIERSMSEREKQHWKRKLKELYKQIPVLGWFIRL